MVFKKKKEDKEKENLDLVMSERFAVVHVKDELPLPDFEKLLDEGWAFVNCVKPYSQDWVYYFTKITPVATNVTTSEPVTCTVKIDGKPYTVVGNSQEECQQKIDDLLSSKVEVQQNS